MHRLKFCVWIEVSFRIVYCCWCFTEAASNEFYFSFICTNVTSSVNARNICFHFRVHENAVFVYLSPSFNWAKGRNEAVVYDYIINIDDNFFFRFYMLKNDLFNFVITNEFYWNVWCAYFCTRVH